MRLSSSMPEETTLAKTEKNGSYSYIVTSVEQPATFQFSKSLEVLKPAYLG